MEIVGLSPVSSVMVSVPRVSEAPVHLECKYIKSVELPNKNEDDKYFIILGEVIGIHIKDEMITDNGLVDIEKIAPIGRMGYNDYTRINKDTLFTMARPK